MTTPVERLNAALFGVGLSLLTLLASAPAAAAQSGVYTAAQAESGRTLYTDRCASCHGDELSEGSAPPLAGPTFRRTWSRTNVTVDDLLYIMTASMPPQRTGELSQGQYVSILAYIISQNGLAAGSTALTADADQLRTLNLLSDEDRAAGTAVAFIEGTRATPLGSGPTREQLLTAADDAANWLYHTRDYSGTRYSPLDEIDTENVGDLGPACMFQLGEPRNFQSGPIVFDGVMYVTGVRTTVALEADTCRPIWRHEWTPRDREPFVLNSRGVAIQDGWVVRATADGYLFALDAEDGELLWARQVADPWKGESFTMAPMIFEDMVLIGPAGSENAISGWVGAFRLEDGEEIWRFHTVPDATREGGGSWLNPYNIPLGGGATWTPFSLDPERGELYVAVTNPAPDLPANLRPGPNLYTNSMVALDVHTGELVWYDQLVPADEHDWDLTQVSPIYTAQVDGQTRNLIATAGKDGMLRVIDRDSRSRVFEAVLTTLENVDAPVTTAGVRVCPGIFGGVEWNGPALHAPTGLLITPSVDWCFLFRDFEAPDIRYVEGQMYLGGEVVPAGPRTGWITAVDGATGEVRWRYHSPDAVIGAVTTTAGNLAFSGELTGDFVAFNATTGDVLYRFNTGGPIGGGVVSYAVDGKQYVAVASGRPSGYWQGENLGSGTVVVFALR
jgi:alcohol dehydrogenase (cytochrome c)